jgi:RNA polymerase sigma-70 factor (ECF subfamily)
VRLALAGLNERERRVLVLVKVEGRTLEEAAALLGLNLNTVKTRLRRGRLRLLKAMGEGERK